MPKKLKIISLKIHKSAGIFKKPKNFLNKGTKYKKNDMEGLNSNFQFCSDWKFWIDLD